MYASFEREPAYLTVIYAKSGKLFVPHFLKIGLDKPGYPVVGDQNIGMHSQIPKFCSINLGSILAGIPVISEICRAVSAARCKGEYRIISAWIPDSTMTFPVLTACSWPLSVNGMSVAPQILSSRFQRDSPCRTKNSFFISFPFPHTCLVL